MQFANPQTLLNAYIRDATDIPKTVTAVPKDRPPRFVRTIRTGGYMRDVVTDVARLTFECWNSNGKLDAERDAQAVRGALLALPGVLLGDGIKIHRVTEVAGPSDSPDPDTNTPRYVLTHEVHVRGSYRKAI